MLTFEQLTSAITEETIIAYQNASVLGLFRGIDIGDIGVENWFHKNLDDIPDAALSLAGFNPSEAKLNADLFSHKVLTAAERLRIKEKELAQFQKFGLDTEGIALLGQKVAELASYYLWLGQDKDGKAPSNDDNYLKAAGSGSLASPSIITTATNGAWGTYSNKVTDMYKVVGDYIAGGFNPATSVAFYPKASYAAMHGKGATEMSAIEMLQAQFIPQIRPMEDQYMYTLAGANPTNSLFDLYLVDLAKIQIGYTRTEQTTVIAPHDEVRDTVVDCEVWFTPYMVPVPKDSAIKKGVSRITAIAPA